ncbi:MULTISPECIES: hypothetical protein [Marinobacter]|uniref:hypothetical protein n=1 Tax=Marinobacter TaxID=2742 RepID=UPI001782942A|nr:MULTISPECIES: hypothetical protein [Marinobacter]MBL3556011.1 hypothetical protein [Marinobacter sp. JB05H06]
MKKHDSNWWIGVADIAASGINHGALKLERVHLAIADETFNVLKQVPVTRPWSEGIRTIHHGIARLSYRSVSLVAASLETSAKYANTPKSSKLALNNMKNR